MTTATELNPEKTLKRGSTETETYVTRLTLNGKTYYSCNFCKRMCKTYNDCIRHIRSHTGDKLFSCLYCKKPFVCQASVEVHERIHTGVKPFSCSACDLTFATSANLIQHTKFKKNSACSTSRSKGHRSKNSATPGPVNPRLEQVRRKPTTQGTTLPLEATTSAINRSSEKVQSVFKFNSSTDPNVTREKIDGKVFYFCAFCQKRFKDKRNAVCHVRIHTGVKPFSCTHSKCNNVSFSQLGSLRRHEKTHKSIIAGKVRGRMLVK